MTDEPTLSKKCIRLKQPYCFTKVHWSIKFREILRDTIVLLSYQVTKGMYEMKSKQRYQYHICYKLKYEDSENIKTDLVNTSCLTHTESNRGTPDSL